MMQDYIVYLVLFLTAAYIVFQMMKKPQAAKSGACGGCTGCSVGKTNDAKIELRCAAEPKERLI
jgi:FeoB-associated Cys-rich membrane protein